MPGSLNPGPQQGKGLGKPQFFSIHFIILIIKVLNMLNIKAEQVLEAKEVKVS